MKEKKGRGGKGKEEKKRKGGEKKGNGERQRKKRGANSPTVGFEPATYSTASQLSSSYRLRVELHVLYIYSILQISILMT